jgi:cytochrome P450/NADPH-cytochrome P450 reductase
MFSANNLISAASVWSDVFANESSICVNPPNMLFLLREKIVVFIVNATEPLDQFVIFYDELQNSFDDLSAIKYAVCGLQNKRTKTPSRVALQLDQLLEQHLCQRVIRFIDIDIGAEDGGESAFERWAVAVCTTLGLEAPSVGASRAYQIRPSRNKAVAESRFRPTGFEIASVKKREPVTPPEASLSIFKITVKLPEGLAYKTGSLALVLPMNPPDMVSAVLDALHLEATQAYRVKPATDSADLIIPELVSARQLLEQYVDLCAPPTRKLLKAFEQATDEEGMAKLERLLDMKSEDGFVNYAHNRSVGEFIVEFAQYGVPAIANFLGAVPLMKPRQYAIASAPRMKRGMLDLYVAESKFGENNQREGLCSSYLRERAKREVCLQIKDGVMEYPSDKGTPLLFIAVGIGIGACMALVQHRKAYEGPFGPALLICQFPNQKAAEVIMEELKPYEDAKLLEVIYAFTEEPGSKYKSFLDVLTGEAKAIWKLWEDDRTRLYCTGNLGAFSDQLNKLLVELTINQGGLRDEEAMAYNARHTFCILAY